MGILTKYTSLGGQAVIEGVMMRSPNFMSIAVRKPGGRIAIRSQPLRSWLKRSPVWRAPFLRGIVTLFESLIHGLEALSYSAQIAGEGNEQEAPLSTGAILGSIISAFVLGIVLFVALPHYLATLLFPHHTAEMSGGDPLFHLTDGAIKIAILLAYVYLISLMKDIRRVFQYHGAEHKSIYAFEKGESLTVERARAQSPLHPRCGTTFLLFLVLISIVVFSVAFPLLDFPLLSDNAVFNHGFMIVVKIVLMLPVAAMAYEFIKACALRMDSFIFRAMIWPGLVLQKLTTREPDDQQLEVGLASLRQCLRLEKTPNMPERSQETEFEIASLAELETVPAAVGEFPEY